MIIAINKGEKRKRVDIFEILFDAICCVMCADRRVTSRERKAVHKILEKTKAPWDSGEINRRIEAFIQRVKKHGLDHLISEACDKLPEFKKIGKEHVLQQCIEYMMQADGVIDENEKKLCQKFMSAISIERNEGIQDQASSTTENSLGHLLLLLDKEPPCGKEHYLQHIMTEFFPKVKINANVLITKQINDKSYIIGLVIGIAEQAGFELDSDRVGWRNYSSPDGVNAKIVPIYMKRQGNDRTESSFCSESSEAVPQLKKASLPEHVPTESSRHEEPFFRLEGTRFPLLTGESAFIDECRKSGQAALILPFTEFWPVHRRCGEAKVIDAQRGTRLFCSSCTAEMKHSFQMRLPGGMTQFGAQVPNCPHCGSDNGILLTDHPNYGEITEQDMEAVRELWRYRCQVWWSKNNRSEGICDYCNVRIPRGEGYHHGSGVNCERCAMNMTDSKALSALRKNPDYFGTSELRRARDFKSSVWPTKKQI